MFPEKDMMASSPAIDRLATDNTRTPYMRHQWVQWRWQTSGFLNVRKDPETSPWTREEQSARDLGQKLFNRK